MLSRMYSCLLAQSGRPALVAADLVKSERLSWTAMALITRSSVAILKKARQPMSTISQWNQWRMKAPMKTQRTSRRAMPPQRRLAMPIARYVTGINVSILCQEDNAFLISLAIAPKPTEPPTLAQFLLQKLTISIPTLEVSKAGRSVHFASKLFVYILLISLD